MLEPQLQTLAQEVRDLLGRAVEALAQSGADAAPLRQALLDLEGPFLLAVVGEFNSGKSSLLNALLGRELLEVGVTPTTNRIQLIGYGPEPRVEVRGPDLAEVWLPHPLLREVRLVDTPGTNAVLERHQLLTERFLPRADLILFVTSADRPFTESERRFLELVRGWGKKLVLVVNKLDLLTPAEAEEVLGYVRTHVQRALEDPVPLFGTSARNGQGVPALEAHIRDTLAYQAARLKLGAPLGVARKLVERARARLDEEAARLAREEEVCRSLEALLERHAAGVREAFRGQVAQLEGVFAQAVRRGEAWLDETVRLGRVLDLLNAAKVQAGFEREVLVPARAQLEQRIQEALAWLARREGDLLETALELLKQTAGPARPAPSPAGPPLERTVRAALERYRPEEEAQEVQRLLQGALQQTALAEAGAVGLGAGLTLALHGLAADVTGVVAGLVAALLGLSILPRRKEAAKRRLRQRSEGMQRELAAALEATLEGELLRIHERFRRLYRPHCAQVEAQTARLSAARETLEALRKETERLEARIEAL
ncbi:dynamin family protein [Marinithermus hydrothermalis]|uniref:Small GTP-binding protein n=1 Tax=Marinithermus hydrothermalis (strain DSM 14884 / JCM 11576 / T1) TaxID=869210 RepID=F2NK99_MARHT|nr:dynamin family protein [Marinithermus hydrothermalis]AEB12348.1 small GTP-binding protein [Marinithermus hydrothermalis DSM 14884]